MTIKFGECSQGASWGDAILDEEIDMHTPRSMGVEFGLHDQEFKLMHVGLRAKAVGLPLKSQSG